MADKTLVLGGCRSGKSRQALSLAGEKLGSKNYFLATCLAQDEEMKERVRRHQEERGNKWSTVEAPLELAGAVLEHGRKADVILADCLTLWISNLVIDGRTDESAFSGIEQLALAVEKARCPVFIVSNEVGTGIVPENRMARRFRDLAGFANQRIAACSDRVIWMAAGIPVRIK